MAQPSEDMGRKKKSNLYMLIITSVITRFLVPAEISLNAYIESHLVLI